MISVVIAVILGSGVGVVTKPYLGPRNDRTPPAALLHHSVRHNRHNGSTPRERPPRQDDSGPARSCEAWPHSSLNAGTPDHAYSDQPPLAVAGMNFAAVVESRHRPGLPCPQQRRDDHDTDAADGVSCCFLRVLSPQRQTPTDLGQWGSIIGGCGDRI